MQRDKTATSSHEAEPEQEATTGLNMRSQSRVVRYPDDDEGWGYGERDTRLPSERFYRKRRFFDQ